MQKTVVGPFTTRRLPNTWWLITTATGVEVLLRGVDSAASDVLRRSDLRAIAFEWTDEAVRLTAQCGPEGAFVMTMPVAHVHEPFSRLYDELPLASFDERAQRFWRRVFRLIRIPGGRYLLRWFAGGRPRRSRARE